jgi:hypothetical protein
MPTRVDPMTPSIHDLIIKAWSDTSNRYLSIWGKRASQICMVFDRETETIVFRAEPPDSVFLGGASVTSNQCQYFIDEKCAEAVLAVLREAGQIQ